MKMLEGVKVLDFTINAAGPIVGAYFADYGAEVVKIEPPGGEAGRRFAYYVGGMSTYACGKDRGKKSIEMNLKDPEAIALIKKILPEYDVVLQSFKPGAMEKLGLGYEDLKAIKPDIIYCSLTAFGCKPSKYEFKPAYDICAVAMSGLNDQTGFPDGGPTRLGSVIGDMCGAEAMFCSALLAIWHHMKTGEGQFIDMSLLRNMIHLNNATLSLMNKRGHVQSRSGNHNANMSPYGIYTGKTASMVIAAVSPSTWNPLCDVMGREDLKPDPRTKDLPSRKENHKFVEDTITDWLMTFDDTKEAYKLLEDAGVPVCEVMTAQEVWENEEYHRLGWWHDFPMYSPEWDKGGIATNRHCPFFADFSAVSEEDRPYNIAPRVGENNMEIMTKWGVSEDKAREMLTRWGSKV